MEASNASQNDFDYTEFASMYDGKYDEDYQLWLTYIRKMDNPDTSYGKVKEVRGNLFTAPEDYSLAHCVAEDMQMTAGIAKRFVANFNNVEELKQQNRKTGGLATLQRGDRFIYYLITKPVSHGKPTYYSLYMSLKKLRDHAIEHNVRKIGIPHISCGLDKLRWNLVKQLLEFTFRKTDIKIYAYDGK